MAPKNRKLPVFAGRFQPLHNGHLEVMKMLSFEGDFAVVIGSIQEFGVEKNPFNFFERKAMIEAALAKEGIENCAIYGVVDFLKDPDWAEKVISLVGTREICVYTRNDWTKECFGKSGIEVFENELYFGICATDVRRRICEGGDWKSLVPPPVSNWLEKNGGIERIRALGAKTMEERIVGFIRERVSESGSQGAIVGVSGGIDSALVAALSRKALGDKVQLIHLPTSGQECPNIPLLENFLGCKIERLTLEGIYNSFLGELPEGDKIACGNLQSRLRMAALFYYANQNRLLVLGTTNRTELELGYFTKYGDGGVDIEPIADLYKTEVFGLARKLTLPREIIECRPTAGLWEGQTDEDELGLTYFQIDTILGLLVRGVDTDEICGLTNISNSSVELLFERLRKNSHKQQTPPICRLKF